MSAILRNSHRGKYAKGQFFVAGDHITPNLSSENLMGLPFNIASYALLTHMIAQQCDLVAGDFQIVTGDTHLYENHLPQAELQLTRQPFQLPRLNITRKPATIFDYRFEDFEIQNYQSHPHIPASVAV